MLSVVVGIVVYSEVVCCNLTMSMGSCVPWYLQLAVSVRMNIVMGYSLLSALLSNAIIYSFNVEQQELTYTDLLFSIHH